MALLSKFRPITLKAADKTGLQILQAYTDFWKIPYQLNDHVAGSTVFTSDADAAESGRAEAVILAPAGKAQVEKTATNLGLNVASQAQEVTLPVGPRTTVTIRTEVHQFSGEKIEPILVSGKTPLLSRVNRTALHLLSVDILTAYEKILYSGLEPNPSRRFKLVSRLPLSYKLIPSFLRDRTFRLPNGIGQLTEQNLGPIEFLRTLFLASLLTVAGPIPRIGFWRRGKTYAFATTHDVETDIGLNEGASTLLRVEQRYGIRSTWNIPSDRYPLTPGPVKRLTETSEIGSHDTKHDGRLVLLDEENMVARLADCKNGLEKLSGEKVRGFRAPLLQHSKTMLKALGRAGYEFDSSCPSWEMLSPTSFQPHGVGTVFPFNMGDIVEIPVSLPQDHQLIRVAGQTPGEAADLVLKISRWIRSIGGACVLLTHPDYEFAMKENMAEYERVLETFRSDPTCDIMTLSEIANWWNFRNGAKLKLDDGQVSVITSGQPSQANCLQAQLVTGYGEDGFRVVNVS